MKIKLVNLSFSFLLYLCSSAQKPAEALSKWAEKSPIEKVYLHFDRDNYIAGEPIWFKAYLSSDYMIDSISTSLYVELVNEFSVVLDRKIIPVFWGAARGQLDIPDSILSGTYLIRAYSATMLNQGEDFIFKRNIFIYGKKDSKEISTPVRTNSIKLEFFPEGGNLVNGFDNAIAFKATDEKGLPVTVNGILYNDKNKNIAAFNSYHDGMGMFEFKPIANEKYFIKLDNNETAKFYLPESSDKGIALAIVSNQKELAFEIQQSIADPSFEAAYIIGQMQHRVVFSQQLGNSQQIIKGLVNTQKLNSGILQVTVFNNDGMPLAERLCFIDNKEYIQPATLIVDTLNFSSKARNRFSLVMKDTIRGSFSIAVTDPAYDLLTVRDNNILSGLLLTADLKGSIHRPSWYFIPDNDSARRAMDLVMMTNGWRRFKWTELTNKIPQSKYKDLSYITLEGRANLLDSKKPFADKTMMVSVNSSDSTNTLHVVTTDKQGNFKLDSMFFWGRSRLLFSDSRGNKSQYIEIKMTGDSLSKRFPLQPILGLTPAYVTDVLLTKQPRWSDDYDLIQKANGLMLEGITVKGTRKKTPVQEVEEKYTTGLFTGMAEQVLDLVNSKVPIVQRNIFEYLQSRVPSITIKSSQDGMSDDYVLYYRGALTSSFTNPPPMVIYLNEMRVDAASLTNIRASDIALVKVYSKFVGAPGNGVGGVLSIYTKKGEDNYAAMPSGTYLVNYKGYSVNKEFYSPDYDVEVNEKYKTDNRITLQWLPDVILNYVDPKIPFVFYNNDRTKEFKVVIEGMANNGKFVMIEKIITAKGF